MKSSSLSTRDKENIFNELVSHYEMDHENIIRLYDHIEINTSIHLLLEHAQGGNLFNYLNMHVKLDVQLIAKFFYQACKAVEHVHSKGFIHRDLKPENILLDKSLNVKLCDFGWCASINDHAYRKIVSGTYEYMSPETLHGQLQGYEADVWSLGVLLFELHHNVEPFKGRCVKDVLHSIRNTPLKFDVSVTPEAKDLIIKILQVEPRYRPTFQQIFSHPFLQKYGPATTRISNSQEQLRRAHSFTVSQSRMSEMSVTHLEQVDVKKVAREPSTQPAFVERIEPRHAYTSERFHGIPCSPQSNTETISFRSKVGENKSNYRLMTSPMIDQKARSKNNSLSLNNVYSVQPPKKEFAGFVQANFSRIVSESTGCITNPSPTPSQVSSSSITRQFTEVSGLGNRSKYSHIPQKSPEPTSYRRDLSSRDKSEVLSKGLSHQQLSTSQRKAQQSFSSRGQFESSREIANKENSTAFTSMAAQRPQYSAGNYNVYEMKPWETHLAFSNLSKKISDNVSQSSNHHSAYLDLARQISSAKSFVVDPEPLRQAEKQAVERTLAEINMNNGMTNMMYPQKMNMARVSAQERGPYLASSYNKPVLARQKTAAGDNHALGMSVNDPGHLVSYRRVPTMQ